MADVSRSAREQLTDALRKVAAQDVGGVARPYLPRSYDERSALNACRESGLVLRVVEEDPDAPDSAHYAGAWAYLLTQRGRDWLANPPLDVPVKLEPELTAEQLEARERAVERARERVSET